MGILIRPIITEKATADSEERNRFAFVVEKSANKIEIKQAIEEIFKVTVLRINTIKQRGKEKRMGRHSGRRPDWKKAMITLKEGDRIEYFEGA